MNFLGRYSDHAAPPKNAMPITCSGTTPTWNSLLVYQSPASHPEFSKMKSKISRKAPTSIALVSLPRFSLASSPNHASALARTTYQEAWPSFTE